jgi:SAM-dependent methyltransferase
MRMRQGWDSEADNWTKIARTPGFDYAYETINLPTLLAFVPAAGRMTLDLGCGEGRISRVLRQLGHQVIGVDASPTMVGYAVSHPDGVPAVTGDGAALPFGDGMFDLVVAHLCLQDFDELPQAVAEASRVLMPGGRLYLAITHPISTAGSFQGRREPDAPFVIAGSYLDPRPTQDQFARDDVPMIFYSEHRPLESYTRALESAGLLIEALREVPASAAAVELHPSDRRWQRIPMFLHLRALKLS